MADAPELRSLFVVAVFVCFAFLDAAAKPHDLPQRSSPDPIFRRYPQQFKEFNQGGTDPWSVGDNFRTHTLDESFRTIGVRLWPILSVPSKTDPYLVSQNLEQLVLRNSVGLQIFAAGTQAPLVTGSELKIMIDKNRVEIGGKKISLQDLRIRPVLSPKATSAAPTLVVTEGGTVSAAYRGEFRLQVTLHEVIDRWTQVVTYSGQHWSLINDVSLQDYLLAVVPSEMPASFGLEALKAQAVAARTYAVFHMWLARKLLGRVWDVDPTTWFQSYRGSSVESVLIVPAVQATENQILVSDDRVIEAFFSSNSGGSTCSISECFWLPDRSYAIAKSDVPEVRQKPGGRWTASVNKQGVWDRLKKIENEGRVSLPLLAPHLKGPLDITGLQAARIGPSGRTWQLSVLSRAGRPVVLNEEFTREMRWQFGFKTSFYDLSVPAKNGTQLVEGFGLGHGVGMSQWGAEVMAKQGLEFTAILKFYYEGVKLFSLQ